MYIENSDCNYKTELRTDEIEYILYLINKEIKITSDKSCTKHDLKILYRKLEDIINVHWSFK